MDWINFGALPWWGVALAFVASFAIGAVWYSRFAFFNVWARLGGLTDEKMKTANMPAAFGQMVVGNALGVIALALVMVGLGATGVLDGVVVALVLGVAFRAGSHMVHNGFAVRHPGITLIDSAHDIVSLVAAGAILGVFA